MDVVNGFRCKDCSDVALAKKHIDPAHPKDGPYGVNAKDQPAEPGRPRDPAVVFGGALAGLNPSHPASASGRTPGATSRRLDVTA